MVRLTNLVYATLIDEAPTTDKATVRENLDRNLTRLGSPKGKKRSRRAGMTPQQAARIAADLEDYDSKISRGGVRPSG